VPNTERWTVSFSRQASDGNYGSETIRVERVLVAVDGEVLDELTAAQAVANCRAIVHAELGRSPNWSVRQAIEEPKPIKATRSNYDDDEDLPL